MRKLAGFVPLGKGLLWCWIFVLAAACSPSARAQSVVNFGPVALGTTSSTQTLTFTIPSGGAIRAPLVVTQGTTGLDFADAGTGSCTTNGTSYTYAAGATCTVIVTFQPRASGAREGAVQLVRSGGGVIATTLLAGTGSGPEVVFNPATPASIFTGTQYAGLATDAEGNLFLTAPSAGTVLKATKTTSSWDAPASIGTGYSDPQAVAVDGAGDVFVADEGNDRVMELPWKDGAYGTQTAVPATGLSGPSGVAVDAAGDVLIADTQNNRVVELPWTGTAFGSQVSLPATGLSGPTRVVVDGAGDVFISDTGNSRVVELPWTGSSYGEQQTVGSGFTTPAGLMVDASGSVYVVDAGAGDIAVVPWTNGAFGVTAVAIASLTDPSSVAIDRMGNLLVVDKAKSGRVSLTTRSAPPELSFPKTTDGAVSELSVEVENIGNEALSFPAPATGENPSFTGDFFWDAGSTCLETQAGASAPFTLSAGAACNLAVDFIPLGISGELLEGTATLTDDTLGKSTEQTVHMSGEALTLVSKFVMTAPSATVAGVPITVSATAVNSNGATVAAFNGTTPVTSTDAAALAPAATTFSAGVASFSVTLVTAGEQTISLSLNAPGLNGSTPAIAVSANTPAQVVAVSGTPQSQYVEAHFATALTAAVEDAYGNGIANETVTFAAPATGASAVLSAASCTTGTDGTCRVTATANTVLGAYAVTATASGISGNATFSLTNEATPYLVVTSSGDDAGEAANCTVQTQATTGTDAACSLRDALLEAAALGTAHIGFDATRFAASQTITLSESMLTIPTLTSVTGPTTGSGAKLQNLVTVHGNGAGLVFGTAAGTKNVELANLTISGGSAGAIDNEGSLTVIDCTFTGNTIGGGAEGGAVWNSGTLTVEGTTFANNGLIAGDLGGWGGAIFNTTSGKLIIESSTFTNNQVGSGDGGAIDNLGAMTIADTTFSGNSAGVGGAILNGGSATVTNSLLTGDTPDECAGIGCTAGAAYVQISGSETGDEAGNITIAFIDSDGNHYSATASYGESSTPASLAATFAPYFDENFSGVTAQAFGAIIELQLTNGANFGTFTFTNPSPFTIAKITEKQLLSGEGDVTGGVGNLTPLGSYGGPTQTLLPLPGNSAICGGMASLIPAGLTTDQRGYANTNITYAGYSAASPCVDAGAVQTQYAMSFTTQPPTLVNQNQTLSPAPAVSLTESGTAATDAGNGTTGGTVTLSDSAKVLGGTPSEVLNAGVAKFKDLLLTGFASEDVLTATLALSPTANVEAQASAKVTTRAIPAITWATPAAIPYGTAVGAAQQDATASVSGTFSYYPAAGWIPIAGAHTLTVTFSPTDTTDYSTTTATVTLTVNPAVLTVTAKDASRDYAAANPAFADTITGFVHGDTISVVSGAASFSTTAVVTSPVGTYPISVAQGTLSAANYAFTFVSGILTVKKATPAITWATPAAIVYGTAVGAAQQDATANVPGSFSYDPAAGWKPVVGTHTMTVTFTPSDTTDYSTATATVTLTVNHAVLTVTANNKQRAYGAANPTFTDTMTGFVHGDTISVVSGAASFSTTATTSSVAGTYPISISQGTLAAANYTFTFVDGTLTVKKATPVITWATPAPITAGTAVGPVQQDATANVPGTFSYYPAAGWKPAAGTHTMTVTFTPADTVDYTTATASVTLTVNPAS